MDFSGANGGRLNGGWATLAPPVPERTECAPTTCGSNGQASEAAVERHRHRAAAAQAAAPAPLLRAAAAKCHRVCDAAHDPYTAGVEAAQSAQDLLGHEREDEDHAEGQPTYEIKS